MLASCGCDTAIGRRDHPILLLARMGLRAGEVAALTLDDFDWGGGVLSVLGKGRRREPLPQPREVVEAMVKCLRADRPPCATRRLFIRMQAPHQGFRSHPPIDNAVKRALARAGLEPSCKGAHMLHHSFASGMLRNGTTLEEIGQILRHSRPATTQICATVDFETLRSLAPA